MATDRERVVALMRHFGSPAEVADLLDTDMATIHAVLTDGGSLPAVGGSGALVVESLAPVTFQAAYPGGGTLWPALADAAPLLPMGPIHLPKAGPYLLTLWCQMIGDDTGPDALWQIFKAVEGGVETNFAESSGSVAADWQSSMADGQGAIQAYGIYAWCLGPTDLYAMFATSNQAATAAATTPITVRNRHMSALPL